MRISIKIFATSLIFCMTCTAFGAGGGEMSPRQLGADPNVARNETPEHLALIQYNYGVRAVEKADAISADAARQTDPKKQAKLAAKARTVYSAALQRLLKATELNRSMHEAWNYLGYTSRKLGNYEDALLAYDRALSLKPGYPEAIEYRAHAYLGLSRLSEAKEAYLTLYAGNRKMAAQLLAAMQAWVREHRGNPAGVDGAMLESFASWVSERSIIAGQTVGLTREGAAAAW
ncbi:MAG: tetratricopeptide repeat protein [Pseudomonadota bacterium]